MADSQRVIELERKLDKLWDEIDKIDEELAELKQQEATNDKTN
jgi:prefoldin subunit 5